MNINGNYTPDEFKLAFPFVNVPEIGSKIESNGETYTVAGIDGFMATDRAAYMMMNTAEDNGTQLRIVGLAVFGA